MKLNSRLALLLMWLLAAGMTGCGGVYNSYVTGMVTMDGVPLPRGTVSFHPSGNGPAAYGNIKSDGTYSVSTGREDGLPSGDYIVTVVANEESVQMDPNSGAPPMPGKVITPAWYRSKTASTLKYTVDSGSNDINLELTSTPPAGWQDPAQRRR